MLSKNHWPRLILEEKEGGREKKWDTFFQTHFTDPLCGKHIMPHCASRSHLLSTLHIPVGLPRLEFLDFLADASGLLSVPLHPQLILCNLLALFLQFLDQVVSDDGQGSCGVMGQGLYH